MIESVTIEGVTLHLSHPDNLSMQWVGQEELMLQVLAAGFVLHDDIRGVILSQSA